MKSTHYPAVPEGSVTLPSPHHLFTLLYFYPKDDTPGCTKEAESFNDHLETFTALNVCVIGVSKDSLKKHEAFQKKYALNFPLISDEDQALCKQFNVLKEKSMFGNTYIGIQRSTFLIHATGTVLKEWRNVKVTGHTQAVLDVIKEHAESS